MPETLPGVLLFDGDSIAAGQAASPGATLDRQVASILQWQGAVLNVAQSGRPMAECLALFGDHVAPESRRAEPRILVIHAGDNDIAAGATGAATYQAFRAYTMQAQGEGWKVVASTELARPTFPPALQAELADYNRQLLGNEAGADAVVDFAGLPAFSDPANRTDPRIFSADAIHPSDGGYTILSRSLADAIRPLLKR